MNHETLTKLIESTEHDYKSFKREFDRLNTLIGAMQYGLNLIEEEFEEIPVTEETTYEPYNYGYMKCLKDEIFKAQHCLTAKSVFGFLPSKVYGNLIGVLSCQASQKINGFDKILILVSPSFKRV